MSTNSLYGTIGSGIAAAIGPVLLSIQAGGLPTTPQGWAGLALAAITGLGLFHAPSPTMKG